MAVPVRMLVQIALMVLVRGVEILQLFPFHHQGHCKLVLLILIDFVYPHAVGFIRIINPRPVSRSLIVSLLIQTRRVDGHKEHLQKSL